MIADQVPQMLHHRGRGMADPAMLPQQDIFAVFQGMVEISHDQDPGQRPGRRGVRCLRAGKGQAGPAQAGLHGRGQMAENHRDTQPPGKPTDA